MFFLFCFSARKKSNHEIYFRIWTVLNVKTKKVFFLFPQTVIIYSWIKIKNWLFNVFVQILYLKLIISNFTNQSHLYIVHQSIRKWFSTQKWFSFWTYKKTSFAMKHCEISQHITNVKNVLKHMRVVTAKDE